jgi:hypothetical protein
MATNTSNPHSFLWEANEYAGAVRLKRGLTVSNTTLKAGDPIILSSLQGGRIALAGVVSVALFGFAAENLTGVTGTRASAAYIPALEGYTFSAQHGTAANTLNITAGYIGKRCGIMNVSNGKICLNAAATTSVLEIVGLRRVPGNKWGTLAQLLVKVVRSSYSGSIR